MSHAYVKLANTCRQRRHLIGAGILGLACVAAGLGAAKTAHGAVGSAFPSTAAGVHRFTGIQGRSGHNFTSSELSAIGRQSDIVVGLAVQLKKYGPALRNANPNVRLFVYVNGMFAQSKQGSSFPTSWYLHDAAGRKITSKTNKNYLMNPLSSTKSGSDAGWAAYVARQCVDKKAQAGNAAGCFLDQMSSAGNTAFVSALPIDPRTKKPFTMTAYMQAVNVVGNAVSARMPTIGNSYESGYRYYANNTRVVESSNVGVFEAEHWLGATQPRDAQTPSKWKQSVQMLIDSQAGGHGVMVSFGDVATGLQQWQTFNVASMLLGNNGHVWMHFDSSSSSGPASWELDTPVMNVRIGTPTETRSTVDGYFRNGVYQRTFTNGLALVNASGSKVTVKLGKVMRTPGGAAVSSVAMAPYTGAVLVG